MATGKEYKDAASKLTGNFSMPTSINDRKGSNAVKFARYRTAIERRGADEEKACDHYCLKEAWVEL